MKLSPMAKNAVKIGSLCSVSYFAVYIARNILGAVTPQMVEAGFTEAYIGRMSSLFFAYAMGQLINGAIGDKIKAKYSQIYDLRRPFGCKYYELPIHPNRSHPGNSYFSNAAVFFLLTYLVKLPAVNIILIVVAIMSSDGAASMLWSRYCPSLRDTGMVSSATGFLDFLSYMSAATANLIFADAATTIGWGWLILVWFGLMIVGVIVALPYKNAAKFAKMK